MCTILFAFAFDISFLVVMNSQKTDSCSNLFYVAGDCANDQFQCSAGSCIPSLYHCNFGTECPDASDETSCGTDCDFENGLCGWVNSAGLPMKWISKQGPTGTKRTGMVIDYFAFYLNIHITITFCLFQRLTKQMLKLGNLYIFGSNLQTFILLLSRIFQNELMNYFFVRTTC